MLDKENLLDLVWTAAELYIYSTVSFIRNSQVHIISYDQVFSSTILKQKCMRTVGYIIIHFSI